MTFLDMVLGRFSRKTLQTYTHSDTSIFVLTGTISVGGGQGALAPWILTFLAKKVVFLVLSGKKTKFTTFGTALQIHPPILGVFFLCYCTKHKHNSESYPRCNISSLCDMSVNLVCNNALLRLTLSHSAIYEQNTVRCTFVFCPATI